jgi:hypothetical protein
MAVQRAAQHSISSTNIADLLERVLDKGIVIAGDIRVSLVNVELLTIQLRLVICSVDKAKEMGIDWWVNQPSLTVAQSQDTIADTLGRIEQRLEKLELQEG